MAVRPWHGAFWKVISPEWSFVPGSWEQTYLRLCQKSLILAKEKDSGYRETNVKLSFLF